MGATPEKMMRGVLERKDNRLITMAQDPNMTVYKVGDIIVLDQRAIKYDFLLEHGSGDLKAEIIEFHGYAEAGPDSLLMSRRIYTVRLHDGYTMQVGNRDIQP